MRTCSDADAVHRELLIIDVRLTSTWRMYVYIHRVFLTEMQGHVYVFVLVLRLLEAVSRPATLWSTSSINNGALVYGAPWIIRHVSLYNTVLFCRS